MEMYGLTADNVDRLETFTASGGTVFRYNPLSADGYVGMTTKMGSIIQFDGKALLMVNISAKDLGEFVQHLAETAVGDLVQALFPGARPTQ